MILDFFGGLARGSAEALDKERERRRADEDRQLEFKRSMMDMFIRGMQDGSIDAKFLPHMVREYAGVGPGKRKQAGGLAGFAGSSEMPGTPNFDAMLSAASEFQTGQQKSPLHGITPQPAAPYGVPNLGGMQPKPGGMSFQPSPAAPYGVPMAPHMAQAKEALESDGPVDPKTYFQTHPLFVPYEERIRRDARLKGEAAGISTEAEINAKIKAYERATGQKVSPTQLEVLLGMEGRPRYSTWISKTNPGETIPVETRGGVAYHSGTNEPVDMNLWQPGQYTPRPIVSVGADGTPYYNYVAPGQGRGVNVRVGQGLPGTATGPATDIPVGVDTGSGDVVVNPTRGGGPSRVLPGVRPRPSGGAGSAGTPQLVPAPEPARAAKIVELIEKDLTLYGDVPAQDAATYRLSEGRWRTLEEAKTASTRVAEKVPQQKDNGAIRTTNNEPPPNAGRSASGSSAAGQVGPRGLPLKTMTRQQLHVAAVGRNMTDAQLETQLKNSTKYDWVIQ